MGRLLAFLLIAAVLAVVVWWISREWSSGDVERLARAKSEVRGYLDRTGSELLLIDPDNDAALAAVTEAVDHMNTARSQLASATNLGQVRLARESARAGLYFIRKAREAMGLDPGPPIPK
ncbi:hypothetical protein ACWDOP_24440 [Nocardia sp. NPDC003693]